MDVGDFFRSIIALFGLASADVPDQVTVQGYVEGEYVRVAAPTGGTLVELAVARGMETQAGALLFALEHTAEEAAVARAHAETGEAEARLADLLKGSRPTEIESMQAQKAQAEASLRLSEIELQRQRNLLEAGTIARQRYDQARAAFERDRARVAEMTAAIETARLAARVDEIRAAQAALASAQAALRDAEWNLSERTQAAPAGGLVVDTLYRVGEFVPAGMPVVTLLPPENVKVRFFVPEPSLGRLRIGGTVSVSCDGCGEPIAAEIRFIAPEAEYTPPVIYSQDSRAKLVFLVEAKPRADGRRLHVGQPVDVALPGGE